MFANLQITSAYLVDVLGNQVDRPIIGQQLSVAVNYNTQSLARNASYAISFKVQGVELVIPEVTSGEGMALGSWSEFNFGWFAESGDQHTVEVTIDSTNSISETSETDNTFTFTFTPVSIELAEKFIWPQKGLVGVDLNVMSYADLDPTDGIRDFGGFSQTYDFNDGLDTGGPNNAAMDRGIEVVAVASGTVLEVVDGHYDRDRGTPADPVPDEPVNYIGIDHGDGLVTYYSFLRRDSLRVEVGQQVQQGDVLGLSGTEMHFSVSYHGFVVETFLDPTAFWIEPLPHVLTSPGITDAGVSNYDVVDHLSERPSDARVFKRGEAVYTYFVISGAVENQLVQAVYKRPNGSVFQTQDITIPADYATSRWSVLATLPANAPFGTWSVEIMIEGDVYFEIPFVVNSAGAPDLRVEESDPKRIVLDERSTPYNFGTVNLGATAPTQSFNLVNHGSAALNIDRLEVPEGFSLVGDFPRVLAAGASQAITVSMTTAAAAYRAGQVRIFSNDVDEAEYNFSVEGFVRSPAPSLSLGMGLRVAPEGKQVVANVRRSGPVDKALTVNLTSSDTTELSSPRSVTIPEGAESAIFFIDTLDDLQSDPKQTVTLTATAAGFDLARNTIDVEDAPALQIAIAQSPIDENGGSTSVTITRSYTRLWEPLVMSVFSSDPAALNMPETVEIPANSQSVTFTVTAIPDNQVQGLRQITISAFAERYDLVEATLQTVDAGIFELQLAAAAISEKDGSTTLTVRRTYSNISQPLVVRLSSSDTSEATVPTSITIPAGADSATALVSAVDDLLLDGTQSVVLTASADAFVSNTINLQVTDYETLELSFQQSSISEAGGTTQATVRRLNTNLDQALTVNLTSDDTTEATVPASIVIPAGQSSATFTVTGVDDSLLENEQTVIISASAEGYIATQNSLKVLDAESLTLTLGLGTISERGGVTFGTVTRSNTNRNQPLNVTLASSNASEATVPASVTIPANQASATFQIQAVDDSLLDGNKVVTISAAATGYTAGRVDLIVADVEELEISLASQSISESGGKTTATLKRLNQDRSAPLVVELSSSDTTELSVPASVTIPADQESVQFEVNAVDDNLLDGNQDVVITAQAAGYATQTATIQVTDRETLGITLDRLVISEQGGTATATVRRNNSDIDNALVLNLTSSDATEVSIPSTVTIPAGQRSATFPIAAVDDSLLDGTQTVTLRVAAAGYVTASVNLDVTDAETLTLEIFGSPISEKDGIGTARVARGNVDIGQPLVVTLSSNDDSQISFPATVTIAAGQASVDFQLRGTDDRLLDGVRSVLVTASAAGYIDASATIDVSDFETLTLTIDQQEITENNGRATGRLTRNNTDIDAPLTVALTSSDPTEATVPASVTIPAGQSSVEFEISAVDDTLLDGSQLVFVTAQAAGYETATSSTRVTDYETLTIVLASSSVLESAGQVAGTITRNNTDLGSAIIVQLSSSLPGAATVPATVTIAAGQASTTFAVTILDDQVTEATQSVIISADANDYQSAEKALEIRDDESGSPWQNPKNPLDVDDNSFVVALDALLLVNALNTEGARPLPPTLPNPFDPKRYYDTNGDGFLSAIDALLVINYLNANPGGEGEIAMVQEHRTDRDMSFEVEMAMDLEIIQRLRKRAN